MWEEFVRRHANVQLVLNGHAIQVVDAEHPWAVARRVSQNDAGRRVHQVLANYQTHGGGTQGFLRPLRFHPAAGRIDVSTYSPYTNRSLTDAGNDFTLDQVDLGAW